MDGFGQFFERFRLQLNDVHRLDRQLDVHAKEIFPNLCLTIQSALEFIPNRRIQRLLRRSSQFKDEEEKDRLP